jgi:hypothetical protein
MGNDSPLPSGTVKCSRSVAARTLGLTEPDPWLERCCCGECPDDIQKKIDDQKKHKTPKTPVRGRRKEFPKSMFFLFVAYLSGVA